MLSGNVVSESVVVSQLRCILSQLMDVSVCEVIGFIRDIALRRELWEKHGFIVKR